MIRVTVIAGESSVTLVLEFKSLAGGIMPAGRPGPGPQAGIGLDEENYAYQQVQVFRSCHGLEYNLGY